MQLSIIIVSYNVKYFLEQCLCSVEAAISDINAEVLVIDNCSEDGSIEYLQPRFPCVTFISNSTNEGFAKANNRLLATAKGEFILFLNPDTLLTENSLQQCIDFIKKHPDTGAVGVRMLDGSGKFLPESKRSFPSPLVSFYKLTGLAALFPESKVFNKYAAGFLPQTGIHSIDVIAGAFMMVSKKVLTSAGSFDERFFMYAEDIDLSYRIQKAGYKNYYLGNVAIIHFKGESTPKNSLNHVRIFYRAMQLFVKKYYKGTGARLLRYGLQAGIALRGLIAAMALYFPFKKYKKKTKLQKIFIAGNRQEAEGAIQLIRQHYPEVVIEPLEEKQIKLTNDKKGAILFCTGSFTYMAALSLLQSLPGIYEYLWFGKETRSVVFSSNKNQAGYFISGKI